MAFKENNGFMECEFCGKQIKIKNINLKPSQYHCSCQSQKKKVNTRINMFDKLKQFLIERAKWKKADKPIRSKDKIDELFKICEACPNFNRTGGMKGQCRICGCNLSTSKDGLNKLAWATTRCPLDEPKWIEEELYREIMVTEEEVKLESIEEKKIEEEKIESSPPLKKQGGCGCKG